jgi:CHAD domain-containing protein
MEASSHDFVLAGDGRPPLDVVRAALAPRFPVAPAGRSRTVRRTWLDTFDWRLHQAGLTLEHAAGPGFSEYTLTGADGERITTTAASRIRWPAFADALPPGPLRARLEQVTSIRALMPVTRATSAIQRWRVLNADDKTIAWLTVDQTSPAIPGAGGLPPRLSVAAVRGYQAQTGRIVTCLAGAPGVSAAGEPVMVGALAAAGHHPGDYTSKINVELTAQMPARRALEAVLLRLLDTLEANVAGTVRDIDTEFLHDLRVAVRRTRSALKLCGDALPAGVAERFRDQFKWLGDVTTPIRDLDVYLLNYPAMAAGLRSATPQDLAPFAEHLARRRELELRRLVRALRSARFAHLTCDWRAALTGHSTRGRRTAARLAAERIRRAHRRVLKQGAAITADSPPESLHDLRKRCKELRYLLEFFASLHDPAIHRQAVRDLKGLQDCLGTYQDCQVQQHEIRMFATQMMHEQEVPVTALLAMGELAGQVATREHQARGEFAGRFADFASAANRQRFSALTTDAGL